jgi:signal peptidase II
MKNKRAILTVLIVLFNIGIDQLSKSIVRHSISDNEAIPILKGAIVFIKAENIGAALGIGAGLPSMLKIFYLQLLPIFILLFLFRMIVTDKELPRLIIIGVAIAIGGAFGNILDRILYGSVTDFIQLHFGTYTSGIFNIADFSVVIGLVLVIIDLSLNFKKKTAS